MKKIFVLLGLFLLMTITFSCEEDELLTENKDPVLKAGYKMTEHEVSPKFGKPNATKYYFQVYDVSGINTLSVKLYELASGKTTYLSMTRSGNLWILSTKITINGWHSYRYVYTKSKKEINSELGPYDLCNTYNVFSSTGDNYLTWPFGADGSSWTNRKGWIDGNEDGKGKGGFGWEEGTHDRNDKTERYSVDWNKGTGSDDLGAELRSPLDGTIESFGTYSTAYGESNFVAVTQETSDGKTYKFYFGHMKEIVKGIKKGQIVRAGVTKLGTLGKSGASSPHAHASLREITNGKKNSVKFYFNAK